MDDCIFCKISKGDIPAEKIYEDKDILAFLDISPINKGHVVVMPKEHFSDIFETPDEVSSKLISATKTIGKALKKAMEVNRVILTIWGEDVPHTHMHAIPKKKDDDMYFWKQGKYDEGEIKKIGEKIRSAF